ncbi:MAG: hypothetical protein ACOYJB_08845 [Christensenellaceae bacterium]|jgi:phenylpyruvate tautomerase PptA (4-oxalocrotonate tautomerase family)
MPHVKLCTNKAMTSTEKESMLQGINRLITLIPGKTPEQTMVTFQDNSSLTMEGKSGPLCVMEVDIFQTAPLESKQRFVEEMFLFLKNDHSFPTDHVYIKLTEFDNWGAGGVYK